MTELFTIVGVGTAFGISLYAAWKIVRLGAEFDAIHEQRAAKHSDINYVQAYARLTNREMGFAEFMALINRVYEFGFQRGRQKEN